MLGELPVIQLITHTEGEQKLLNTHEPLGEKPQKRNNLVFVKLASLKFPKKTFKINHASTSTWRKIFLVYGNDVFEPKDKVVYDRHSTIPNLFVGSKIKIFAGARFHTRIINRWMVGYKFGEFSWTRKLALYKAKQLKKKKKK